jgi:hypothetical protein
MEFSREVFSPKIKEVRLSAVDVSAMLLDPLLSNRNPIRIIVKMA